MVTEKIVRKNIDYLISIDGEMLKDCVVEMWVAEEGGKSSPPLHLPLFAGHPGAGALLYSQNFLLFFHDDSLNSRR